MEKSISLSYETVQYIFAIGASDITDLIGNTLGGVIGIAAFCLLSKLLKDNTIIVINALTVIGTVFAFLLFGAIIMANI